MDFVVGVDGGGTKTECVVLDLSGREIARDRFGSLNMNSRPAEEVEETIRGMAGLIRSQAGTCRMVTIGAAGAGNPTMHRAIETILAENGYTGPYTITGDQNVALYAAHDGAPGLVLISGTGSICFGVDAEGRKVRVGGWGYKIDDEGSGYAVGRDILAAVMRAADGRIPGTALTALVAERMGTDDLDVLIRGIYASDGTGLNISTFADLLPAALTQGDAAAGAILEKAADELSLVASAAVRRLSLPAGPLAFAGGMLLNNPRLMDGVSARLRAEYPELRCFPLTVNAALGAARMALGAVVKG